MHVLAARALHAKARPAPHVPRGHRMAQVPLREGRDHAPLCEGRGLLAPRGPPSAGLQTSGPSFVSSSTKFNS
jgi:hypothetical protein